MTYSQRSLEGNLVSLDALNGSIRDSSLSVLEDGGDIDRLPSNWCLCRTGKLLYGGQGAARIPRAYLGGLEDVLHGLRDLRADTVTLDDTDCVAAL